ncbi:hypothetical protein T484DRAFT_3051369 [Baffinella frigidus]|nr:hypothetical protein T484DRAFT_3051369 [Cryptophyta sp. CCMP2293]
MGDTPISLQGQPPPTNHPYNNHQDPAPGKTTTFAWLTVTQHSPKSRTARDSSGDGSRVEGNNLITPKMTNPRPAPPPQNADQHLGNTSHGCSRPPSTAKSKAFTHAMALRTIPRCAAPPGPGSY